MKKIISFIASTSLLITSATAVFAADKDARHPDVYVNASKVAFADQNAYITDEGRTLVPARGVFEAMGCTVNWDAENYVVTVSNENQGKNIILKIDDANMKVVTGEEETTKTLEVPAQLMNNRTMIPLRAVSESFGCMVMWDEANYTINISEMRTISADQFASIMQTALSGDENKEIAPKVNFSFDSVEGKAGDTVEVKLMYESEEPIKAFGVGMLEYDESVLEIVDFTLDDDFKKLVNVGLSKYSPDLKSLSLLFNEEQSYEGCLGTFKIKINENAKAGETLIGGTPVAKNSATRSIKSALKEGNVTITE